MAAEARPDPLAALRAAVEGAASRFDGDAGSRLTLERPPKPELGDYSTNAAMLLAPTVGASPREVAERLRDELAGRLGGAPSGSRSPAPAF